MVPKRECRRCEASASVSMVTTWEEGMEAFRFAVRLSSGAGEATFSE